MRRRSLATVTVRSIRTVSRPSTKTPKSNALPVCCTTLVDLPLSRAGFRRVGRCAGTNQSRTAKSSAILLAAGVVLPGDSALDRIAADVAELRRLAEPAALDPAKTCDGERQ